MSKTFLTCKYKSLDTRDTGSITMSLTGPKPVSMAWSRALIAFTKSWIMVDLFLIVNGGILSSYNSSGAGCGPTANCLNHKSVFKACWIYWNYGNAKYAVYLLVLGDFLVS